MKVKVTIEFHDINDLKKVYHKGEVHDFEDTRAEYIISLGYGVREVEKYESPKVETKPAEPEIKEVKVRVKKTVKKND